VARFLDARAKTNFKFAISEGVIVRKAGDTPSSVAGLRRARHACRYSTKQKRPAVAGRFELS